MSAPETPPPSSNAEFERAWRKRFEQRAGLFDDDAGIAGWSDSGLATRMRRFVSAWRDTPEARTSGGNWLDAGCGAGTYTRFMALDHRSVTAVDYSIPSVIKAHKRCSAEVDAHWAAADVTKLPFKAAAFEGVLCFGVMQALSSPRDGLRELRRVLAPGGVLWVDALNGRCLPAAWSESKRIKGGRPAHLRYDEIGPFMRAIGEAGFEAAQGFWIPIAPQKLRWLQPLLEMRLTVAILDALPSVAALLSHSILFRAVAR